MQSTLKIGRYLLPSLVLILAVLFVDQYVKWLVMETVLRHGGPANIGFFDWLMTIKKLEYFVNEQEDFATLAVNPFLNIVMVWNRGISFGMMNDYGASVALLFIGLAMIISLLLIIWIALSRSLFISFALSLIVGGAFGNVVDRVRFNAVIDFLDFHLAQRHWPAFNVADAAIVLGALLIMSHTLLTKEGSKNGVPA